MIKMTPYKEHPYYTVKVRCLSCGFYLNTDLHDPRVDEHVKTTHHAVERRLSKCPEKGD